MFLFLFSMFVIPALCAALMVNTFILIPAYAWCDHDDDDADNNIG